MTKYLITVILAVGSTVAVGQSRPDPGKLHDILKQTAIMMNSYDAAISLEHINYPDEDVSVDNTAIRQTREILHKLTPQPENATTSIVIVLLAEIDDAARNTVMISARHMALAYKHALDSGMLATTGNTAGTTDAINQGGNEAERSTTFSVLSNGLSVLSKSYLDYALEMAHFQQAQLKVKANSDRNISEN